MQPPPSVFTNGPFLSTLNFQKLLKNEVYSVKIIGDLLGTYDFLASFSNTVSTQQVSNCKTVRPTVMLSTPKPLDEIQPNLVCELHTKLGWATLQLFCPTPWGPEERPKGVSVRLSVRHVITS